MRCVARLCFTIAALWGLALAGGIAAAPGALAQSYGAFNQGRNCQVIRTCNFKRNGEARGCLSSYSCRVCKLVPVRCTLAGRTRCEQFVCTWGG